MFQSFANFRSAQKAKVSIERYFTQECVLDADIRVASKNRDPYIQILDPVNLFIDPIQDGNQRPSGEDFLKIFELKFNKGFCEGFKNLRYRGDKFKLKDKYNLAPWEWVRIHVERQENNQFLELQRMAFSFEADSRSIKIPFTESPGRTEGNIEYVDALGVRMTPYNFIQQSFYAAATHDLIGVKFSSSSLREIHSITDRFSVANFLRANSPYDISAQTLDNMHRVAAGPFGLVNFSGGVIQNDWNSTQDFLRQSS